MPGTTIPLDLSPGLHEYPLAGGAGAVLATSAWSFQLATSSHDLEHRFGDLVKGGYKSPLQGEVRYLPTFKHCDHRASSNFTDRWRRCVEHFRHTSRLRRPPAASSSTAASAPTCVMVPL